ncbi:MAG: ribbon-helix-helix protein, CopG family [Halodesulfurarchaeum sp.]|nr:ribbon-helix-helix protein, CopG family [Halodesulfurarchaeum sp.]
MSISMPVEMDGKLAEEARRHGMSYSEYVRHILREHAITPFNSPSISLEELESERQEGAA